MASPTPSKTTLIERLDALNEYEREPVKEKELHNSKSFIAMFSSEHVAGTEFILGPLLVMRGCLHRMSSSAWLWATCWPC
jgi:cytosine permease